MNGHDFTREQNMEAKMTLAAARRGLAAAINDAENGIGHLSCDDPKIMEQVRAHWRRLYDTYMNADAIITDLESCARHLTDGDVIDGHIFRLKEPGREWECAPCFGITVRMLHEWGPWALCDFNPKDDEAVRLDWCKPWIADHGWDDDMSESASSLLARIEEIRNGLPEEAGLWRFEHAGSGVVFGDGGGEAPVPVRFGRRFPGRGFGWTRHGSLYFLSDGRTGVRGSRVGQP